MLRVNHNRSRKGLEAARMIHPQITQIFTDFSEVHWTDLNRICVIGAATGIPAEAGNLWIFPLSESQARRAVAPQRWIERSVARCY